jgi:hypothetical protein
MPLNRHDWAAIYAKVAFIAMLKRVLVECGVIGYEILFAKNSLVPVGFWALRCR